MRSLVYGVCVGAAAVYLYFTQGALVDSGLATLFEWRDTARQSVEGYGGFPS